jgi:RNA polymerase sigma factor (sigma-70 family)
MDPTRKAYDLDLSRMGDEELVVLAQECGYLPAANELILRYHEWKDRLIAQKARRTRLTAADVQDAQQNAFFALREAINRYDTEAFVRPNGCSFRTFLRLVITSRFQDFVKHCGRTERHFDRHASDTGALETGTGEGDLRGGRRNGLGSDLNDPAAAVEWQEALSRLEQALARLGEEARRMWELLATGMRVQALAKELGVSYDTAKRLRQRLLADLKAQLREGSP